MVKTLTEEIEHDIESIENDYLKDSYTIRANEIMAYNQLIVHNNVEAARLSADKIIESNARPAFKAHAYYIKGYSYLFTSYENSIGYLNKSVDVYHSLGRENDVNDLRELIEFTGVYWGKLTEGNCYYVKNQLLLDALNGKDISSRLVEAKENIEPEFYLFLEGLNKKNEKKLMLSMIKFIKKNDLFLANLVKLELFKTGYDEEILEELTGIQAA
jgi:hypothetical protein